MKKKSILKKSLGCAMSTAMAVAAISYTEARFKPRQVDFSAFKNIASNVEHLAENTPEVFTEKSNVVATANIINVIEKEVRLKVKKARTSLAKPMPKLAMVRNSIVTQNGKAIDTSSYKKNPNAIERKINIPQDFSKYEINNRELLNLYGVESFTQRYETFSNTEIAFVEESPINDKSAVLSNDIIEDSISSKLSSTRTNSTDEASENDSSVATTPAAEDDFVVFDYPNKDEGRGKKIFDAPISNTVKRAIEREVQASGLPASGVSTQKKLIRPDVVTTNKEILKEAMESADSVVYEYSAPERTQKKTTTEEATSAFVAANEEQSKQSEFIIKANEINLNTQKIKTLFGYEFVPDYDRAERTDDQASGEIKIGYSLTNSMNIQTGVVQLVQSQGLIPTRVELDLAKSGMNIPLINEAGIQKFLQKRGLDIVGNLIMIAIDPSIQDVEIDSDFGARLYFSENFKLVEAKESARYVMFLGVKTGNILIRYLLNNQESTQKIIYVGDGEMYYEDPEFIQSQRDVFTFTTRSLLGRKVKELNIDANLVSILGGSGTSKKKALNAYEIKIPEMVDGSRKYLEFMHLDSSLFVGINQQREVEIPGKDFIERVLQTNNLSEVGSRCMVQINLQKDLRDIKVSGKNSSGEMFTEMSFLDKDGNFSLDNSEMAEKVFLTGDMEGVFSARLEYSDGSSEFLKTFCRQGAYIVEQL